MNVKTDVEDIRVQILATGKYCGDSSGCPDAETCRHMSDKARYNGEDVMVCDIFRSKLKWDGPRLLRCEQCLEGGEVSRSQLLEKAARVAADARKGISNRMGNV